MCGRIANTLPSDSMARLFAALPSNSLPSVPNFNICPTNDIHVVRASGDTGGASRALVAMRWGFIPHWYKTPNDGPLLINARAETIAEKPAFRAAVRSHRCLIPASGYYEWTKDAEGKRLPWYFTRADRESVVMAGIWQTWSSGEGDDAQDTCAVVTCAANAATADVHHRMPVILAPRDWGKWLGEEGKGAAILMQPAPDEALNVHRVRAEVNSNRASGAQLIEPFETS
ncbi:SOS response-associated peptidase [Lentibacter algarum]|uniref:SOS response-associated peptidase n=1 Tax=Lentibacter algarum TaxID=576131 RepID=UPI001C07D034|nr:SOS response-associated peptidase [Lentibacter algarum]MBU2981706.1 SOS response-associated peptidase [Lentibacter algarum]